ncbi:UDP-glucuronosyltransferase 2B37-like [Lingula anatina]|uniref:UDP-glucuronosyltransferase n=1 Tax=Lingula anatina TaxID=7574 RepID=A0A1S3JSW8_LINAN|nr:UDP-glucuronosyltransferase 2B37-like [Lingula anatina]|eukprot:XP_013413417.1 UDP-glucuronosyltransferase 2B37-like [Lingula anatina]
MLRESGINLLTFTSKEKMFLDDPEVQRDILMAAVENPELRTSLFHLTSTIQKFTSIFESYLEEMFVDKELDRKHSIQPITPELSQKHAPGRPYMSTPELMAESELWIVDGGQPAIDHVKPSLPNVKYLGGLVTRPAKPLPKDLETFLKKHDHGVVLVSFGSLVKYMPDRVVLELFEAFKNVPYGVIWKYNGQPLKNVPGHVKIMSWMPQNDILGHPNTKLFITHAGNNGQMEALYHGVPMISIPLFGDQDYNAARAEQKGIAITMDAAFLKSENLISAINMMMQNDTYAKNMRRASAIFRDQPGTPVELAGFWIDHVIKHGGSYMKSHARLLPWYQFYMLDVMLVFLAIILLICLFCGVCCSFVCKKLRSQSTSAGKQKTQKTE